jgi:hypothetical protein
VDERLRTAVARELGSKPTAWRTAGGGYTHNERWIVELADGRTAFVKAAVDELSAGWLRDEQRIYASARGSFLPRLLGWAAEDLPVLILEDLSGAYWPPPWSDDQVGALVATLAEVAATPCPPGLGSAEDRRDDLAGWTLVERDPDPFLRLELCSEGWLEDALPRLVAAERACVLDGDAFLLRRSQRQRLLRRRAHTARRLELGCPWKPGDRRGGVASQPRSGRRSASRDNSAWRG